MKTTTRLHTTALCLLALFILHSPFFIGRSAAQTTITGSLASLTLGAGETIIASGAQILADTSSAQIVGSNANAMTLTIQAGGMVGKAYFGAAATNVPVQGINFSGAGRATVYNYGTIIMGHAPTVTTVDNRYALRVNNNASSQGGEIHNFGYIFSAYDAIMSLTPAEFILVNSGTLHALNANALDPERGVYIRDGSNLINITNSGLITAGGMGISIKNENRTAENFLITNSGTIETTRTNIPAYVLPAGSGAGPGTFGATAAISFGRTAFGGGSGVINNTGLLRGAYTGIFNTGTNVTINNNGGSIQGTANYGIISIVDAGRPAPFIRVNNTGGLISGGAVGIHVGSGAAAITNTGTISANGATPLASVFFASTAAADTSSLTLGTGAVLEGDVLSAKAAGNSLVLQGSGASAANFLGSNAAGVFNAANGFEFLSMSGAAWTLSGTVAVSGAAANAITLNSGTLTLSGALLVPANAGITLNSGALALDFAGNSVLAGVISGNGGIIHAGAGLVELTGANTYTGVTTILTGTLAGNIGASALNLASASAAFIVNPAATSASFGGLSGIGVLDLQNASLVFDVQGATPQTYNFAGTLTSNGGNKLIKEGNGKLILAQSLAAQLTGGAEIRNGILSLSNQSHIVTTGLVLGGGSGAAATAGLIEFTGAGNWTADITLAGAGGGFNVPSGAQSLAININGAGAFIKDGAGSLDITGASFAAGVNATEIRDGSLVANEAALRGDVLLATAAATLVYDQPSNVDLNDSRAISGAGSLVKTGAGLLNLTGDITFTGDTIVQQGTLQGKIGAGDLRVETGATYKVADGVYDFQLAGITGNGNVDLNASSLTLDVAAGQTSAFNFSGNLTSTNPVSKLIKTGAGTTNLQSAVVLPGGVEVQNGVLRLADQSFITTPVVLGSGLTAGLIEYTGAAPWAHNITLATGGGGGFSVPSGAQTLSGFTIAGAGNFVKAGAGALDITAANFTDTVNGSVRVLAGALRGSAANFKSGGISLESAAASVEFNQTSGAAAYTGAITGPGSLIKTGAGALSLTGANSYGDTEVREGLLTGGIGSGLLTIAAAGTYRVTDGAAEFVTTGVQGDGTLDLQNANLVFNVASGTSAFDFAGTLAGGNQFIKDGAGLLALSNAAALPGGSLVRAGVVRLASQSFLGSPVTLGSNTAPGFLEYTGAAAWTSPVAITGQGGGFVVGSGEITLAATVAATGFAPFIKDGAGTLDATGAAFNGVREMKILAGTLRGDAAALASMTADVSAGATFELRQAAATTFTGVVLGEGDFRKSGAGAMTVTGILGHTGFTRIDQGRLVIGAPGALPPAARIVTAAAGSLDIGALHQTIDSLANAGAVYIDATVNSRTGSVHSSGQLEVTGAATGNGKILVRLAENAAYSPSLPQYAIVARFPGPVNYTFGLAERAVDGPYDWNVVLSPSGNNAILAKGRLSPEAPGAAAIDAGAWLAGRASLDSVSRRLASQRATRNNDNSMQLWAQWMRFEDTLNEDLYKNTSAITNGYQIGAEWDLTDLSGARTGSRDKRAGTASGHRLTGGIFYDAANSRIKTPDGFATSNADSNAYGVYASYRSDVFYVDLVLRNARNKFNGEVFYGELSRFRTSGYSFSASLEVGGQIASKSPWKVEPMARLTFQRHTINPFVDGMNRRIEIDTFDSQEGFAAVRLSRQYANADRTRVIAPYLRAGLAYEGKGGARIHFPDPVAPATFANTRDGSVARLEAGVACLVAYGIRVHLDASWYEGPKLAGKSLHLSAGFTW